MRRIVVTGIGAVSPAGVGRDSLLSAVRAEKTCIGSITRFDCSRGPVKVAGEVRQFRCPDFMPPRMAKRSDRFSHLAVAAGSLALKDAKLDLAMQDRHKVGIALGNNLGGWEFGERGLAELFTDGPDNVNPYQASAWFPAAAQGQISLNLDIKGFSKTYVADRTSGLVALAAAVRAIRQERADIMLAGGTEAPIAPYAMLCHICAGNLSAVDDPARAYRPFDRHRSGLVLAEGAVILILEELEHALRRGALIYGEIRGYALMNRARADSGGLAGGLATAMRRAMLMAGWRPDQVDYVCAEGSAVPGEDEAETAAIKKALGPNAYRIPVSAPKTLLGHMYGAAGPADVAIALVCARENLVPPTLGLEEASAGCDLDYVAGSTRPGHIERLLVNSHGFGGVNASMAIRVWPAGAAFSK